MTECLLFLEQGSPLRLVQRAILISCQRRRTPGAFLTVGTRSTALPLSFRIGTTYVTNARQVEGAAR